MHSYLSFRLLETIINGEGEIHFLVITADTGTSGMVTGM